MDMGNQEKYELENKNEDPLNYSAGLSSDWRFGGSNVKNTSMGLVPDTNSMVVSKGDLIGSSSCSSASMVDSFGATPWNNYDPNSQNLGFGDNNSVSNANQLQLNPLGIAKGGLASLRGGIDRTLDMCWNQPNSMLKGGYYLPNVPVMLPQNLSQLPTDSALIERAAKFSCFEAGNFTDMVNHPFPIPDSVNNPYSKGGGIMLGNPQEVLTCDALKPVSGLQSSSKCELNVGEASKVASVNVENGAIEGSPLKSSRKSESFGKSHDEAKEGMGGSGNESDEAEFSGASQEEPPGTEVVGGESSAKRLFSKKRKRNTEDNNIDGVLQPLGASSKDNGEMQQKVDQNPSTTINKTSGKNCKQVSQASDPSKQEYIHVRARRGQATNSHSLAERVRREKISERMKFLQDLVPGCNKVTGKAVMLDEIINYVQSLQRQVEFLSMKLATVNPRLDFNLEELLAKDILQPRVGPSHTLAFSQDMPMAYSMLHPSHQGLTQAGLPGVGISSDVLRRPIGSQLTPLPGGFKEPTQLPNVWEDELNNVIQMSYGSGTSAPPNIQDVDGHMKADL